MTKFRLVPLFAALAMTISSAASAKTLIKAELWDKGAPMDMSADFSYGARGPDKSQATMGIKLSRYSFPQGHIKFEVKNSSKNTTHEMIVLLPKDPNNLPYDEKTRRLDDDNSGHKGELSELAPGMSGEITLDLKPGRYLLICNIPGHYKAGMWEFITVTK